MSVMGSDAHEGSDETKIFGPAKPLLSGVGDRQPVRETPVVPQRRGPRPVSRLSSSSALTSCSRCNDTPTMYHTLLIRTVLLVGACSRVSLAHPRRVSGPPRSKFREDASSTHSGE
jgi:hypothetical protein